MKLNPKSFLSNVVVLALLAEPLAWSQQIRLVVSSRAGDRLAEKTPTGFKPAIAGAGQKITIRDDVRFQTMDGFGATFQEAGMMSLRKLPSAQQEQVLRALFDAGQGAGFSAMKTVLASTDFMSAGPFYSYDPVAGDVGMNHFSIDRDLGPDGLITFIKRARQYGKFVLEAPMDYPPDWMLYDVRHHQDVQPRYYDALALYYLRYLQEYEKNGVLVDHLSLFNEPGIYTKISYEEIGRLLGEHVGPLFSREHLRTTLAAAEAPDRKSAGANYPTVLRNAEALKYIGWLPYHGYDARNYNLIRSLHKTNPQLPLWMTEVCYAYISGTPKSIPLPQPAFDDGEFWGNMIYDDLEASASAWIYWNMILNEHGGPWAVSVEHENPDNNVQHPVVIINEQTKQVTYTGLYYYLAHFSRYVRPGSVRLETDGSGSGVRAMSFRTPGSAIVTELMNSNKTETAVDLTFHGKMARLVLPAGSITTAIWSVNGRTM